MSIKVDITPLLKDVGRTIKIDEEEKVSYTEDDPILKAPVKISGTLTNTGETILFKGKVKTVARITCGRCLNEFDEPVEFVVEEEYAKGKNPSKKELGLGERDFVFEVGNDNSIDLSEVIRQNILTELPIAPICSECRSKEVKDAAT